MTFDPHFAPMTGSCRCGQARIRLESAPIITHACHCRLCQQDTGSAFRAVVMVETDRVALVEGRVEPFQAANGHEQMRCPDCGCVLWLHRPDLREAIAFVGLGVLDEGGRLQPEAHFYTRSKHPWVAIPAGVAAFETVGDPGKAGARERIVAALEASGVGVPPGAPEAAQA